MSQWRADDTRVVVVVSLSFFFFFKAIFIIPIIEITAYSFIYRVRRAESAATNETQSLASKQSNWVVFFSSPIGDKAPITPGVPPPPPSNRNARASN